MSTSPAVTLDDIVGSPADEQVASWTPDKLWDLTRYRKKLVEESASETQARATSQGTSPSSDRGAQLLQDDSADAYRDAPPPPADPQAVTDGPSPCPSLRALFYGEAEVLRDLNSALPEKRSGVGCQEAGGLFTLRIEFDQDLAKVFVAEESSHALCKLLEPFRPVAFPHSDIPSLSRIGSKPGA
jgi:hypothetical protein